MTTDTEIALLRIQPDTLEQLASDVLSAYGYDSQAAIDLANDILEDNDWDLGIPDEQIPDSDVLEGRGLKLDTVRDN